MSQRVQLSVSSSTLFYVIAFIEGGAVMAVELAGAKMIAPFYGTSLYVWSSVLAVTLGGLTVGYFLGGWASYRFSLPKLLSFELLLGAVLIALMPFLGLNIIPSTMDLGVRSGSLLSSIFLLMPPLICMGMVSPTIIQLNNTELKGTGKTTGTVYAISTFGGILMTLLMGFYLLPEWGIRKSVYLASGILGLAPMLILLLYKNIKPVVLTGMGVIVVMLLVSGTSHKVPKGDFRYLYQSEGILGQLLVMENPDPQAQKTYRHLFINHVAQTWVDERFMPFSEWGYPHRLATLASILPPQSKALLIGLGGGNIAMEFKELGFDIDVVELDERIPAVAEQFFGFEPEGMNVIIDDGRHFLNRSKKTYDLICIDVLNGEVQPQHMFTLESFQKIKNLLSENGLLLINNQGYVEGEHGLGSRAIMRTLDASGLDAQLYYTINPGEGGDVHFIASKKEIDFRGISEDRMNPCCRYMPHRYEELIQEQIPDYTDAPILRDDQPLLEKLNDFGNQQWRETALNNIITRELRNKIPFFN